MKRLELFDENENVTVLGKILLVACCIIVLAIVVMYGYYSFMKIRFFFTH